MSDGCDAVLLGAETAQGRYPIQAVQEIHRISLEAGPSSHTKLHIPAMQVSLMTQKLCFWRAL